MTMTAHLTRELFALRDEEYRAFQSKLIPNVDPARILGVRVPQLRALAGHFKDDPRIGDFLSDTPHRYYEEDMLHGLLIASLRDYNACIAALDTFLPLIDNWAVCDSLRPCSFKANTAQLARDIPRWLASDAPFTVRFGIEMYMIHFLDDAFDPAYSETVAAVQHDHYYVRMMVAWYMATALSKQWEAVLPIIAAHRLPAWTHRKAIQKAKESYRMTNEQKAILSQYL